MFKVSETKILLEYPADVSTDDETTIATDQLWNELDSNFNKTLPFVEETIERWNGRTQLLGNLKQTSKKSKDTVFNATIVARVRSMMGNEESKARIIEKTQVKRDTYRVLGRPAEDLHKERDADIFNDFDFYQVLLSDFLQTNELDGQGDADEGEGSEGERKLLGNADIGMTQSYLRKRQRMKDAAGRESKGRKEVDRKASKNRKIRYVVHDKILNFLTPMDNLAVLEGRDAIVDNLFGAGASQARSSSEARKKAGKKDRGVSLGDGVEDTVQLL